MPRIGVFICHCGTNIADTVDVENVAIKAGKLPDVVVSSDNKYTCADPGQEQIKNAIKEHSLDRIVIASCSPKMHEKTFSVTMKEAGLNPYLMTMVNLREQDSWVHSQRKSATEKALALVEAGISRARHLEVLKPIKIKVKREVAVLGGGIAGITLSLELAEMGYRVFLIEKSSSIGGRMAQLSKTYPTLDCAPCILSPKMVEAGNHPNIEIMTDSELVHYDGNPGNFEITVKRNPRGVNVSECVGCGACSEVCPVEVPHEFEEGLYKRKAIHRVFDQAVPNAYTLDFNSCLKCGQCVSACPKDCIDLEDMPTEESLKVGAIAVATGFDLYDLTRIPEYNFKNPAVITASQLERKVIVEGAGGKILKRENGKRIKKLGFVFCAGSRSENHKKYCSKICCTYAAKQALLLKKTYKFLEIHMHYIDVRTDSKGAEELYCQTMDSDINYIRGKVSEIIPEDDGTVSIIAEDTLMGETVRNNVDLAVLLPALVPSEGTLKTAEILNLPLGQDEFLAEKHIKLDPVATLKSGIYAAGCSLGPKDVHESAVEGKAVAGEIAKFLGPGEMELSPMKAKLVKKQCSKCEKCIDICPSEAVILSENAVDIDIVSCTGCGACIPICPDSALDLPGFTNIGIKDEISALSKKSKILGFFGDELSYTAADAAGTARMEYSHWISIMRVPTAMRIGVKEMLFAIAEGAEGVLLSDEEHTYAAETTLKWIAEAQEILEQFGVEKERIGFMEMLLPVYRMLPKYVNDFVKKVENCGELDKDKREELTKFLDNIGK